MGQMHRVLLEKKKKGVLTGARVSVVCAFACVDGVSTCLCLRDLDWLRAYPPLEMPRLRSLVKGGWGWQQAQEMLLEMQKAVLEEGSGLPAQAQGQLCAALALADKALVDGSDEFLQLLRVGSVACASLSATA